jgi:hypothetical protein
MVRSQAETEVLRRRLKIFGVILAVLMVRVWETVQSQRLERQISGLRLESDRLTYENGRLQMMIHQYEAPSHLEVVARGELNMIPLDASHRIGLQP